MSVFRQSERLGLNVATCRVCPASAEPGSAYCEKHRGEAARLLMNPARAGYRSAGYRKARQIAYRRARGRCESCGAPLPRRPDGRHVFQTHHIDGNPLNNDPANLQVCGECCHSGSRCPT